MSGGAKTRSHKKRAAYQEYKEMDNSDQRRDSESVSEMLKDIKMELQSFRTESKQDMLKMREELRQDVRVELALLKTEVYQSISANTEKANTLERKLTEAETRIAEAEKLKAERCFNQSYGKLQIYTKKDDGFGRTIQEE